MPVAQNRQREMMNDVIVVGGGPAGMMAAYAAAENGRDVLLIEKNEKLGKKLYITGKGRCNITNACALPDFISNINRNPKFMMSALNRLSNEDLIGLLKKNGLNTKVERGERVFPVSDKSSDVIKTFEKMLRDTGVKIALSTEVKSINKSGGVFIVCTNNADFECRALIVATGGLSYPSTGSTGDGYRFSGVFGHTVVEPHPALVPLEDQHNICARMQGLTLKNVGFALYQNNKMLFSGQGELLFTHFGLSGPLALSASSYIDYGRDVESLYCVIDLKPALGREKLEARILRDFSSNSNKQIKTYMTELLPSKLIYPFLEEVKIAPDKQINQITKTERTELVNGLKGFRIKIGGVRPFEEAVITSGGIKTSEINPSTMESKLVEGLYFAGEVIDVSALTGGFNLQIAFSTGYAAGKSTQG